MNDETPQRGHFDYWPDDVCEPRKPYYKGTSVGFVISPPDPVPQPLPDPSLSQPIKAPEKPPLSFKSYVRVTDRFIRASGSAVSLFLAGAAIVYPDVAGAVIHDIERGYVSARAGFSACASQKIIIEGTPHKEADCSPMMKLGESVGNMHNRFDYGRTHGLTSVIPKYLKNNL